MAGLKVRTGNKVAGREFPPGIGQLDRLAIQFWDSLTPAEQAVSPLGPPEGPMKRLEARSSKIPQNRRRK